MIIKEIDASKYICPMVNHPNQALECLGSRCMAWRWHTPNYGYCGIAGNKNLIFEEEGDCDE